MFASGHQTEKKCQAVLCIAAIAVACMQLSLTENVKGCFVVGRPVVVPSHGSVSAYATEADASRTIGTRFANLQKSHSV